MTKSALRVMDIMEFISRHKEGCSHKQLSNALGIPKSSLTALLRDMVDREYILLDEATGRHQIGPQILSLSHAYLRNLNVVRAAEPIVAELFASTGQFSAFAIPKGVDYVIICAEYAPLPLAHSLQIGERSPMYCSATGKAILAHLQPSQRDAILDASQLEKLTPATKVDPTEIKLELAQVARAGIAYAREESIQGIIAMAVPAFNSYGKVVGALSVAMPVARFDRATEALIIEALRRGGIKLSAQLGWREAA